MKTQGPLCGTGFCPRRSESNPAMGPKRSVTDRSAEDRRTGEITTERMPANQEALRLLFGGGDGGVIDPAVRPIRSVIPRSAQDTPAHIPRGWTQSIRTTMRTIIIREGETMATTYNNLYLDTRARLKKAGIEGAQLEARELICYAADKSREQFYRDMPLYVSGELERRVETLVQRRLDGEPVAYIVGEWEFYGLPLDICSDVLIPRIDTEVLAERGILRARGAGTGARVLDLCAGSGCVGLAVAANAPDCRVVLGELSEGALRVCKQNVRRNGLNARVTCLSVDAMQPPPSTLWDFDVIVCNPPYIPTGDISGLDHSVKDFEPHMALDGGTDGLDYYRFIAAKWKSAIRLGGALIFEVGIGQAPDVEEILAQNGFDQIQTTADTQGIWRVVEGTVNH